DQWFCGFSPYYTIACWNGYDQVKPINRAYPYTSTRLFNTVMNTICSGLPVKTFEKPENMISASICQISGLVATDACKHDPRGDQTKFDYFAPGNVPTKTCDVNIMVKICSESNKLANEYCPNKVDRSFITRDLKTNEKLSDAQYMVPTETCTIHTKPVEVVPPPEEPKKPEVDIYGQEIPAKDKETTKTP
ncbi:MAG: hypothetical protein RSB76_00675, partial [Clostridia bacterium]